MNETCKINGFIQKNKCGWNNVVSLLKQAKWSPKCRSLKQRWMELHEVCVLLVLYSSWFWIIFVWILFHYWKKLGGVGVEHWNKGEWSYVRFLCFLFCFHVFFSFCSCVVIVEDSWVEQVSKVGRGEMELCEVYVLLVLFSCCFSFFSFWYYYFIVEPN